jgi:hypothetical protein
VSALELSAWNSLGLGWKSHSILTHLNNLQKFPEQIGRFRTGASTEGWQWWENRQNAFKRHKTENLVLVFGGAQAGLGMAARLKTSGVSYLVLKRGERIGGNWRSRYRILCLHDPVCKTCSFLTRRWGTLRFELPTKRALFLHPPYILYTAWLRR